MQLMIDVSGSAREEIETTLEFGPPPDFKKVHDAIDWAETNMPMNVYFEVWGHRGRVWFSGYTRTGKGAFHRGINSGEVPSRPCPSDLRCGR